MRLLFVHAGLVVEPAGAAGVAAVLEHPVLRGSRLATVLCGGNVTPAQADEWFFRKGDAS
jgi:threonine dehydratase